MKRVTRLPRLKRRPAEAHKGDFGRVLVVAGSYGMAGAAAFAALGAVRAGAGLVYAAVPERIYPIVATLVPHAVFDPYPGERFNADGAEIAAKRAARCGVLALGPGLGQAPETEAAFLGFLDEVALPLVLDADGLNLAAKHADAVQAYRGPKVLTPHPGEAGRLLDGALVERVDAAERISHRFHAICLLKGRGTVVTDGERYYVNPTGNPGMASGGTGDVLTGVVAALIGQRYAPFDAACLGAHLHGLAGDLAAKAVGLESLTAVDVLEHLPKAFVALARRKR